MTIPEMPPRQPTDGMIGVKTSDLGYMITVANDGKPSSIEMSEYNAWRLLGSLSLMLGLPLSKAAQRAILL